MLLGPPARIVRIERHPLGPRCHVLGRRLHEWHAGAVLLLAVAAAALLAVSPVPILLGGGFVGAWLVAKDWHDLVPSKRDTTAWRVGLHRPPRPLRPEDGKTWLPPTAAALAAVVGGLNLASTLTPELPARVGLLLQWAPAAAVTAAHALALPAGLALLVLAVHLRRGKRRAAEAAIVLLLALAGLELVKGLDVEEALVNVALAGLLLRGRSAFRVEPRPLRPREGVVRALGLGAAVLALGVLLGSPGLEPLGVMREAVGLLTLTGGPTRFAEHFGWLPLGLGALGAGSFVAAAWSALRPLAPPAHPPAPSVREAARTLVRGHGHGTLSMFALRTDVHHLVAPCGRAFLSYRVEGGVLLVSGDPVGDPAAVPGLVRELCAFADARDLRIGAVGAGAPFAELARQAGLHALYMGDEAILDVNAFSLEGRAVRKLRQSVARLERAGYACTLRRVCDLSEPELGELEALAERARGDEPERGFSMAMDGLRGEHLADSRVLVATDANGQRRGLLHFVPAYGAPAVSLSLMRRDAGTPNGLTEFMVARAVALFAEEGVEELSLNFAAFARWLHSPATRGERMLGRLIALANPYFQIESLYRFNAKFSPRWVPRYLLHEGLTALPRVALAALWAEGHLPRPHLRPAVPA